MTLWHFTIAARMAKRKWDGFKDEEQRRAQQLRDELEHGDDQKAFILADFEGTSHLAVMYGSLLLCKVGPRDARGRWCIEIVDEFMSHKLFVDADQNNAYCNAIDPRVVGEYRGDHDDVLRAMHDFVAERGRSAGGDIPIFIKNEHHAVHGERGVDADFAKYMKNAFGEGRAPIFTHHEICFALGIQWDEQYFKCTERTYGNRFTCAMHDRFSFSGRSIKCARQGAYAFFDTLVAECNLAEPRRSV